MEGRTSILIQPKSSIVPIAIAPSLDATTKYLGVDGGLKETKTMEE